MAKRWRLLPELLVPLEPHPLALRVHRVIARVPQECEDDRLSDIMIRKSIFMVIM